MRPPAPSASRAGAGAEGASTVSGGEVWRCCTPGMPQRVEELFILTYKCIGDQKYTHVNYIAGTRLVHPMTKPSYQQRGEDTPEVRSAEKRRLAGSGEGPKPCNLSRGQRGHRAVLGKRRSLGLVLAEQRPKAKRNVQRLRGRGGE